MMPIKVHLAICSFVIGQVCLDSARVWLSCQAKIGFLYMHYYITYVWFSQIQSHMYTYSGFSITGTCERIRTYNLCTCQPLIKVHEQE